MKELVISKKTVEFIHEDTNSYSLGRICAFCTKNFVKGFRGSVAPWTQVYTTKYENFIGWFGKKNAQVIKEVEHVQQDHHKPYVCLSCVKELYSMIKEVE